MTHERAQVIAATLVREFGRERFFSLSLPKADDLEQIAEILRSEFDCTVVQSFDQSKISVYYPPAEVEERELASVG